MKTERLWLRLTETNKRKLRRLAKQAGHNSMNQIIEELIEKAK